MPAAPSLRQRWEQVPLARKPSTAMATPAEMRAAPHPVAAAFRAAGWADSDGEQDFDEAAWLAEGWKPEWRVIRACMERQGLLVEVIEARVDPWGFVAVWFDADEIDLPRTHLARNNGLHISLGYLDDWPGFENQVRESVEELNATWAGRTILLPVERMSSSARIARDHPLAADPNILYWQRRGRYRRCPIHISL